MADQRLGNLTVGLNAETNQYVQAMKDASKSTESLGAAASKQAKDLDKLTAAIDPVAAAYGRLDKLQDELNKSAKQLDAETFTKLNTKIAEQRLALEKSETQMQGNAKTARELSFALRNLPAQFTDIAVSLQAGQAPLTVLMQQGGQLKDMFGGVGPAAKVMGEYIIGLAKNPLVLLTAAIGAVAYGFTKAAKETENFNKALILTGNLAGTSTNQLSTMAMSIDSVVGTYGNAASVLTKLAASGKIAAEQLEEVALASINFQRATGQEIDDILSKYNEIYDDPIKALQELAKNHGILNVEVYKQVEALSEEGRQAEATALAVSEIASAQDMLANKINETKDPTLGFFKSIADFAKEAADAIGSVFRESTTAQDIEKLQRLLETMPSRMGDAYFDRLRELLAIKKEELVVEEETARLEAEASERASKGATAQAELNKLLQESRSDVEKLAKEYLNLDKLFSDAQAAGFTFTQEQIASLYTNAMSGYLPDNSVVISEADKYIEKLKEQEAVLIEQQSSVENITASRKELAKFEERIRNISKNTADEGERSLLARENEIRAQLQLNVSIEEGLKYVRQTEKTLAEFSKMYDSLLTKEEKNVNLTAQRLRLLEEARDAGADQLEIANALNKILSSAFAAAPDLSAFTRANEESGEARINRARDRLIAWHDEQLKALDELRKTEFEYNEQWDEAELRLQEEFARSSAILDSAMLEEKNKKFSKFAEQAAKNMQDAFADFLFDPFDKGLEGMLKGFVNVMRKIAAEQAAASTFDWFKESGISSSVKNVFSGVLESFMKNTGLGAIKGAASTLGTEIAGPVRPGEAPLTQGIDGEQLLKGIKDLGLTIAANYAGAEVGNAIGEALFNKQAESNLGQQIGSTIGSIFGPQWAFVGSTLGSMLDVLGGGDGYKRANAGFLVGNTPGAKGEYLFESEAFASGLEIMGFARREDQAMAKEVIETFRGIDALLVEAVNLLGGELKVTSLNGLNEEATSGSSGTFLGLGRDANLIDQINYFVDQLADNITGLDEALINAIKSAESAEAAIEILNDAIRIRELEALVQNLNGIKAAKDQFSAQTGLVAVYEKGSQAVKELMQNFQGTVEQTEALSVAILNQQQAVYDLTWAFLETQQAVDNLFGGLAENIRKSLMGQEELYNYEREQVRALTALLDTLTDPEAIFQTAQEIERRVASLWGSLGEESRQEMGQGYLDYLEGVQKLAQEQIAEGMAEVEDKQENINQMLISGIRSVVDYFMTGSQISLQASQLQLQAAQLNNANSGRSEIR